MDYKKLNAEQFDAEIAKNTGFKSMNDLVTAKGNYCPSCDVDNAFHLELAERFDLYMRRMNLPHRAYRYGHSLSVLDKAINACEASQARQRAKVKSKLKEGKVMNYFYVETRSLSDEHDRVITKTQAESAHDAVAKIKRQHAASGADNRDFTYTINPHSRW